jgi:hypothetical protein
MRWHADGTGSAPEAAQDGARRRRRRALAAAVLLAALAHGLLGGALRASGVWSPGADPVRPPLEVIGLLTLTEPPPTAAPAAPRPVSSAPAAREPMQAVAVPMAAASAPAAAQPADPSEPAEPPPALPVTTDPTVGQAAGDAVADPAMGSPVAAESPRLVASGVPAVDTAASAASGDSAAATAAPPFEWPPSTRVSYDLTGWYRGEVQGRAQVEWVRDGDRYTVRLDVAVGLPAAPLVSRRMASEGRLTAQGLAPERYEEVTQVVLRDPRRLTMAFTPLRARMADGRELPVPPVVQDTASQFIHMAYRFATEPGLSDPGRVLELPLALPRRIDTWTYDVVGAAALATPFGTLTAVHVRPRPLSDRRDVLTAEAWFAPGLRWLPVRILIRQDAETHVDLLIARLPDLLAREAEAAVDRSRTAPPAGLRGDGRDPSVLR